MAKEKDPPIIDYKIKAKLDRLQEMYSIASGLLMGDEKFHTKEMFEKNKGKILILGGARRELFEALSIPKQEL